MLHVTTFRQQMSALRVLQYTHKKVVVCISTAKMAFSVCLSEHHLQTHQTYLSMQFLGAKSWIWSMHISHYHVA